MQQNGDADQTDLQSDLHTSYSSNFPGGVQSVK